MQCAVWIIICISVCVFAGQSLILGEPNNLNTHIFYTKKRRKKKHSNSYNIGLLMWESIHIRMVLYTQIISIYILGNISLFMVWFFSLSLSRSGWKQQTTEKKTVNEYAVYIKRWKPMFECYGDSIY